MHNPNVINGLQMIYKTLIEPLTNAYKSFMKADLSESHTHVAIRAKQLLEHWQFRCFLKKYILMKQNKFKISIACLQ